MDTFSTRLRQALASSDTKPIDLSRKTGISKSSISDWLSGKYEAKQDKVFIIAKALNVDEAWLMGLNVPRERTFDNSEVATLDDRVSKVIMNAMASENAIWKELIEILDPETLSDDELKSILSVVKSIIGAKKSSLSD